MKNRVSAKASELQKFMRRPLVLVFLFAILRVGTALADAAGDVTRLLELSEKLRPGMTIEALNDLLGPPAEAYHFGGRAAGTVRYQWLHGNMGVSAYEVEGAAYRVDITLPCGSASEAEKAMGALTRQGEAKYGPTSHDRSKGRRYYWVRDGIRFAYFKYDSTTVQSSRTLER